MQDSSTSNSPANPASQGSVRIVLLVIFLDLLGFGIVLPMIPYIAGMPQFKPSPWIHDLMASLQLEAGSAAVVVGLLAFCYSVFQFLMAPVWGKLSDRVGRRPILVFSMAGYTLSWAMFAFAPNLEWLLLSRIFAGITAANIATAQAYMADIYPPEERAKGMGLVGAAFGLGFTLGPPIGAGLMALGAHLHGDDLAIKLPVFFSMGLSLAAFLYALWKLPESLPPEKRGHAAPRGGRLRMLLEAVRVPVLGPLLLAFFTATFGFAVLESLLSEFNRETMEMSKTQNSMIFGMIGLVIVIIQGGLIGRLTTRLGMWKLLNIGLIVEGICLILLPFSLNVFQVVLIASVMAIGNSLCNPSVMALISRATPDDRQGSMMGLSQASSALGRVLGPLLGAVVWALAAKAGFSGAQVAFGVGGFVVLLALPMVSFAHRRSKIQAR